jgi:hypothetical protein
MKLRFALVVCLQMFVFLPSATAHTRRSAAADSASLRTSFLAAFGEHFDLVKDEFKSHPSGSGSGRFWLAYVNPKHPGYFALQYRYKPKDPHYSHVEHEIYFGVGPKGCRRGPPDAGVYGRFCVGDTVIIPMVFESSGGYEFKLVKGDTAADEESKTFDELYPNFRNRDLDQTAVANPSASLRYVGRDSHKTLHRSPGYTLHLYANFEAVKAGKFNLVVGSSAYAGPSDKLSAGSIPIIVVDRGTPVTLIAGREETRGFSMGSNGQEWLSSTSGNSYMTNLIVLQPGDRISFSYLSVRRGPQFEREGYARSGGVDPAENMMPVISVHQFALVTQHDFGAWLVDYLP